MLTAAVRRIRQPGAKFDEMLVLESEQGLNKSLVLQTLAVRQEWWSDQLQLGQRGREAIEATSGKWIVEVPELQGMRKADVERVKAWLSAPSDRGRMAYGMTVTEAPRQFVCFGTTNGDAYLRDNTGNRRFWPVRVQRFDVNALEQDRDQLWAEAAQREASGASIRLPEKLWSAAAEEQRERMLTNEFTSLLDEILRDENDEPLQGKITVNDVWQALGIRPGQRHQGRQEQLGTAMRELGWSHKRLRFGEGKRSYCYTKGPQPHRTVATLSPDETGVPHRAFYEPEGGRKF